MTHAANAALHIFRGSPIVCAMPLCDLWTGYVYPRWAEMFEVGRAGV